MAPFREILLVEDSWADQWLARGLIEKHGLAEAVVSCKNGREALCYLTENGLLDQDQELGLVLLDISMSVMNGLELLEALRDLKAEAFVRSKVVVLSSSGHVQDREAARRYGVKAYLEKPLTLEKLCSVL